MGSDPPGSEDRPNSFRGDTEIFSAVLGTQIMQVQLRQARASISYVNNCQNRLRFEACKGSIQEAKTYWGKPMSWRGKSMIKGGPIGV